MTFPQIQRSKQQPDNGLFPFLIYVTPLPLDIKEEDLRFLFSLFGEIKKVIIGKKPTQTYFFGFVYFDSFEAKEKAKKFCDGKMLGWKCLTVKDRKDWKQGEIKDKKSEQNWEIETVYEEELQKSHEQPPKKKVHLNESKYDIDKSFGKINFKNQANSYNRNSYKKNFSFSKFYSTNKQKENFDNRKRDISPKKLIERPAKGKSSSFPNKKQDPNEISY